MGPPGKYPGVSGRLRAVSRGAEPKVNRGRPGTTPLTTRPSGSPRRPFCLLRHAITGAHAHMMAHGRRRPPRAAGAHSGPRRRRRLRAGDAGARGGARHRPHRGRDAPRSAHGAASRSTPSRGAGLPSRTARISPRSMRSRAAWRFPAPTSCRSTTSGAAPAAWRRRPIARARGSCACSTGARRGSDATSSPRALRAPPGRS